jgi:hypothetical protein
MLLSLSTVIACGDRMSPAPKCATSVPFESNLSTGSSVEVAQLFVPHRSATQILLPSRSMSTALVEPHVRPSGIFAQSATVVYGLGALLIGAMFACAAIGAASANQPSVASAEARTSE